MRGLRVAEVALIAIGAALTGVLYSDFFATSAYLPPVLVAAAGGALVVLVSATRGWRLATTVLATTGGLVLLAAFWVLAETLRYGLPTAETAAEFVGGVTRGWARMLSIGVPADVTGELLITPVLLTWAASAGAAMLAVRSASVLAPVAPLLAAFGVALLYIASAPGHHLVLTAAFAVATLLLLLLRANRIDTPKFVARPAEVNARGLDLSAQHRRLMARRVLWGVPVLLGVALLGTSAALTMPLASGDERFDPRSLRPPRLELGETVSPLATVKSQLRENPPRRLLTVRLGGGGAVHVDRVRVAALDSYDGVRWSSADRYLLAGQRLGRDPALTEGELLSVQVKVEELPGPFVPVAGWPLRIDPGAGHRGDLWFSGRSGGIVTDLPSLRGFTYQVLAETRPRDSGLLLAPLSPSAPDLDLTALPAAMPPRLAALAARITEEPSTPYGKLEAIERHLRALPYSLDARPGHSYGALTAMLASTEPGDGLSYSEQRAAAFAVLARSVGIPARVAVGYLLREATAGVHMVTSRDAYAWSEVRFAGYGWVSFDPTDLARLEAESARAAVPAAPGGGVAPTPTPTPGVTTGTGSGAQQPGSGFAVGTGFPELGQGSGGGWVPAEPATLLTAAAVGLAGLLALVGLGAGAVLLGKARRRKRRLSGDQAARVVGAWRESTDRLIECGVDVPPALTAEQVAARATAAVGAPAGSVAQLAPMATAAVFAPTPPNDDDARRAWALEHQLRRDLAAGRGRAARLRARLDPRPLLAERRGPSFKLAKVVRKRGD